MTVLIIGNWSLFDIWCLVLEIFSLCRYLDVGSQGEGELSSAKSPVDFH
jgi:hypothetical protein